MRRRIYISMMTLTVVSVILTSIILCFLYYSQFTNIAKNGFRERAEIFINMPTESVMTVLNNYKSTDIRITLIDQDGSVKFDNMVSPETLSNHLDRKEVKEALKIGYGESTRFSDTLGIETYYYSVKLSDGSILRFSKATSSFFMIFRDTLPVVICIVLVIIIIGYVISGRLTKKIVEPIVLAEINKEIRTPYDELTPFVRTIAHQQEHIKMQLSEINNSADTINTIMDSISEGIVIVNEQGVILSINKSASSIFDALTSMNGKNILELVRDAELLVNVRSALSGSRGEMSIKHSGNTYRVFFSPVTDSGAIILFLDITEKTMSEKLRREFSANVSHELKTPLTSIYGYAEMLYNGMVKESDKRFFFGKIKDEASRLITLIEDIIMISELDEDKYPGSFEKVDLCAIAYEAISALSLKASENKVCVSIAGKEIIINANPSLMYEMFYNLIDNAIKYNKQGGTVKTKITQESGCTKICVTDTGIGIPRAAQSRVFERFYRVDKSRSKNTGGTGLGLAIVKHIVMVHGGQIKLRSEKGEGTTVCVIFLK